MDQKHAKEPSSTSAAQRAQCQCPKTFPDIIGLTRVRCILRGDKIILSAETKVTAVLSLER